MLWALPASNPGLFRSTQPQPSSSSSSHIRYCSKSISILTPEANAVIENFRNPPSSQGQPGKIPRYTKWSPQIAKIEEALKLIESSESVDAALVNWEHHLTPKNIVTILNNLTKWQKAYQFVQWLNARSGSYELNTFVYNVLLKILRNGRQFELSEKMMEDMIRRGLEPDNFTYSTLINCAKRCQQPEQALKWFEKMKDSGIIPDEITYNSVIDMYGRVGRVNDAVELYEKLRSLNWKLDTVTYGALANVYARMGDYKSIMKLVEDMKESGTTPNAVIWNTLIGALSRAGKVNHARKVFRDMKTCEVSPTPVTMSILIEMYTRVGAYDQAFEIYEELKSEGFKCDTPLYNSLLKACVESGNVSQAEDVLEEMKRVDCKLDHLTYRTAMNVYATRGDVDAAMKLFDTVVELRGKPDTPLYTVMIKACKQAGEIEKAGEIFIDMIKTGCEPDERLTGVLLSCMTVSRNDGERLCVLECLRTCSASLHELVSSIMSEKVPVDEVSRLVEDFIMDYPETSSRRPICNSLIDICCSLGMKQTAHKVFSLGVTVGAYEGLQTNLPSLWRLNLRTLSLSAAECAVEAWCSSLALVVEEEEELPQDLIIETGVGRERSGQRLNPAIGTLLKNMDSPFTESLEPAGYYHSTGPVVKAWIKARRASSKGVVAAPALLIG